MLLYRHVFSLCLKDGEEAAVLMSSGSSFHKIGSLNAKLWLNGRFLYSYTGERICGALR